MLDILKTPHKIDETDKVILRILQKDCRVPLKQIAKKVGLPKSTLHYKIRRLEQTGIVQGYYAKLSPIDLGNDYLAIVLVRARYGPGYHGKVGRKLSLIPGVWAVYYVLGEIDFIVLIRAADREDYMRKLERISNMKDIERTSTQVVAKVIKEDPHLTI